MTKKTIVVKKPPDYLDQLINEANKLYKQWLGQYNKTLDDLKLGLQDETYKVLLVIEAFNSAAAGIKSEMDKTLERMFNAAPREINLVPKKGLAGAN